MLPMSQQPQVLLKSLSGGSHMGAACLRRLPVARACMLKEGNSRSQARHLCFLLVMRVYEVMSLLCQLGAMCRGALCLLGVHISRMAGSNDGAVVDRETALDWAHRLQDALEWVHMHIALPSSIVPQTASCRRQHRAAAPQGGWGLS
jgi:hypothetical protein